MAGDNFGVGVLLATVVWCGALSITHHVIMSDFKSQAIEHGAARYHPTTGEFEWIDRAEQQTESKHASREN